MNLGTSYYTLSFIIYILSCDWRASTLYLLKGSFLWVLKFLSLFTWNGWGNTECLTAIWHNTGESCTGNVSGPTNAKQLLKARHCRWIWEKFEFIYFNLTVHNFIMYTGDWIFKIIYYKWLKWIKFVLCWSSKCSYLGKELDIDKSLIKKLQNIVKYLKAEIYYKLNIIDTWTFEVKSNQTRFLCAEL